MGDTSVGDFGTAYYRSMDPIKNLKIRVHLRRVTGSSLVPEAFAHATRTDEEVGEVDDGIPMKPLGSKSRLSRTDDGAGTSGSGSRTIASNKEDERPNTENDERFIFEWQMKVFSRREVQLYSSEASCEGPLDQKYHDDVLELKARGGRKTKRLFTYTDHDGFTRREEQILATSSPNETPSFLAEKMSNVKRRRKIERRNREGGGDRAPLQRWTTMVLERPSEDHQRSAHVIDTPINTMYIMADLGSMEGEPKEEDECVLCTIKVSLGGVISVCPDFTHHREPYTIVTDSAGRDTFHYTLTVTSQEMSSKDQDRESKMYRELLQRHTDIISAFVGQDFEQVPPGALRLCILGEIISAKNFEYDGLYVHYFIELPRHWSADKSQMLSGVTQTCSTKEIDREYTAYFSHPFELELFYRMEEFTEDDTNTLPSWPQLCLEVLSLDSWQRYRTEGYGYITVPPTPGTHTFEVNMWRPLGRSSYDDMRRFFIGGSPELEDPGYVSVPSTHDGKVLSRFGLQTETTGSVAVRLNLMQQSRTLMDKMTSRKQIGTLIDRMGGFSMQSAVTDVLDLFQRARKRMQAAKDTLSSV